MNHSSITIFEKLLDGYHPVTGEKLAADHVLCEPEVIRAFHHAITALKNAQNPELQLNASEAKGKLSAKREWTEEDDRMLFALYMQNFSIKEMAKKLSRKTSGIEERLDYLREAKRQQFERRRNEA